MALWHAVIVTQDSVSGVPYNRPLDCDSCRQSLPLFQVDSLRMHRHIDRSELLAIPVLIAIEFAVCALLGARNGC